MLRRAVSAMLAPIERRAGWVVVAALAAMALMALYVSRSLQVRTALLELLPEDSAGLAAFERQRARAAGGASLLVIVESPDRAANRRYTEALADALTAKLGGDPRVAAIEPGTHDVRAFYEKNRWLYASPEELEDAFRKVDSAVAKQSGLVEDFDDDAPGEAATAAAPRRSGQRLGVRADVERWRQRARDRDPFPTGWFETDDGRLFGIRISANVPLGDATGDALVADVRATAASLGPSRYSPQMTVGLTGDIAAASAEKAAIVSDAAWATAAATGIILAAIAWHFRSAASLLVVGLPAAFGVVSAYAFATAVFGYVNVVGAFLGAIILGNGINYPIVLLSRYQEFRARGMAPRIARVEAVVNAFRAELVGALVASIAYGSLSITEFRGFRQFGVVGFVGMLVVWLVLMPLVPALTVLLERAHGVLPRGLAWLALDPNPRGALDETGGRRGLPRALARWTTRRPWVFIGVALVAVAALAAPLPRFLGDPWEYDFGRLGSRHSDVHAYGWSDKADAVFGGKANIAGALLLADSPEQAPELARQILANDAHDPQGRLLDGVVTLDDYLPGGPELQRQKLEILGRIRDRLTPAVLSRLDPDERALAEDLYPPESLRVLGHADLPEFVQRRFRERDGRTGTVLYVRPRNDVVLADGHNQLRIAKTTDEVRLPSGVVVHTASSSTVFAEILRSMRRDGPLASLAALGLVALVVLIATHDRRGAGVVLGALGIGVVSMLGGAAWLGERINYVSFIAIPITCGIGCEYPFNLYDRARLLGGDVAAAVRRSAGPVTLCSFTTVVGYGALLFSDVQALESFGKMAVFGELACVLSAVCLVPSLLVVIAGRRAGSASASPGPRGAPP